MFRKFGMMMNKVKSIAIMLIFLSQVKIGVLKLNLYGQLEKIKKIIFTLNKMPQKIWVISMKYGYLMPRKKY